MQGFFIPLDYGHIVGMIWVAHEVVLIALANGYVVLVSAPLLMRQRKNAAASAHGRASEASQVPVTTKSMSTTRIFQNYLSAAVEIEGSPAVIGDTSLKVLRIDMAKWGTDECLSMYAAPPFPQWCWQYAGPLAAGALPPSVTRPEVTAATVRGC